MIDPPLYCRVYTILPNGIDEFSTVEDEPCGIIKFDSRERPSKTVWYWDTLNLKWIKCDSTKLVEILDTEYETDIAFELFPILEPRARKTYTKFMFWCRRKSLSNLMCAGSICFVAMQILNIIGHPMLPPVGLLIAFLSVNVMLFVLWWKFYAVINGRIV